MSEEKQPDESSPLLPGEFVAWKNILWHEVDPHWRNEIVMLFDSHWANGLKEFPYYVERIFLKMWTHYRDPRDPS